MRNFTFSTIFLFLFSFFASGQNEFITTWKTDNEGISGDTQITIPTFQGFPGEFYNYEVNWGDGTSSSNLSGNATHTYSSPGTYQVAITGTFPRIFFDRFSQTDRLKIMAINQWGTTNWSSMEDAFYNCNNLDMLAQDVPDLSNVLSTKDMFAFCWNMIGNSSFLHWNVSTVRNMSGMLSSTKFNQPIGNWDVTGALDMSSMFFQANDFNQSLNTWDVSNVLNMAQMFRSARSFNQPLNSWDVSNVRDMFLMFSETNVFNQPLDQWNVSLVTNMAGMFRSAFSFNQSLNTWNVRFVNTMEVMFWNAVSFNGSIGNWNVSRVENMSRMFDNAQSFDQNIGGWDVGMVTNMTSMFINTSLSIENYDALLIGWSDINLASGVSFSAGSSQYCEGIESREKLIADFGWTITDGGENCDSQVETETEITKNEFNRYFVTDVNGGDTDDSFTISTIGNQLRIISNNTISSEEPEVVQINANTVEIPLGFINNGIFFEGFGGNNTAFLSNGLSMPNGFMVFDGFSVTVEENGTVEFLSLNGISNGSLNLNGATVISPSDVNIAEASLFGNGTIDGIVNLTGNANLEPGASPGRISTGNFTIQGSSIYSAEINGSNAFTQHDQLIASGTVTINNAVLNPIGGYANAQDDEIILISNDGTDAINGTFNNLPEGAAVAFGDFSGVISYVGGDGNDVVLTASVADTTPPFLTANSPNGNDTPIDTDITMTFSEPIQVVPGESVTITEEATGTIHETFEITDDRVSVDGVTATFNLVSDFSAATEYRISLTEGAFADLADNRYDVAATWFFTTVASDDNVAPTLVSTNPIDGAIDVPLNAILVATFSEPVQWATEGSIVIQDLTENVTFGTLTESSAAIGFNGNAIEINPIPPFIAGHEYEIQITDTSLEDAAGNLFVGIPSAGWTFTTLTGLVDLDNDGFFSDVDCNDNNPAINPDAIEICDGIDNNCDGLIDDEDPTVTCDIVLEGEADLVEATYLMGSSNPSPIGPILRVEEGNRETYLKFDLSSFNGSISNAELQMNVASDPGSGTIEIFLGSDSNWNENNLNGMNKPSAVGGALASISGTHSLGQTKTWNLDVGQLSTGGEITLVVKHSNGNDVAFASDETAQAPKLLITAGGTAEPVDNDGDGFFNDVDCDDDNPAINPDAIEICDGIDNNCDGLIDGQDPEVICDIVTTRDADLIDATFLQGSGNPSPTGPVLRVEQGNRETYLKFDLDGFSRPITEAILEMQVASDPGNGTLEVFLASNSNWTESGLNGANKPSTVGNALALISGTHSLGQTKTWNLDVGSLISGGEITLVVKHSNGNDVAFASDESSNPPKLRITAGSGPAGPVDMDGDGFFNDVDCDDDNPAVNPDAIEVCDGIDNNCDGLIDDEDLTVTCNAVTEIEADLIDATFLQGSSNPSPTGPILRVEEGNRVTYLKFDTGMLNGEIVDAELRMQVASDPGNGTLEVFLGSDSDWTETNLNGSNKPLELGNAIGEITGTHSLGQTKVWNLDFSQFNGGVITLIVKHSNGNDVAFASDETSQAPELTIVTEATEGSGESMSFNELRLSPNPANNQIGIGFENPESVGAVFVYDITGKLVLATRKDNNRSVGEYQLDVSQLTQGVYFIRTFDEQGLPHQKTMLVEH